MSLRPTRIRCSVHPPEGDGQSPEPPISTRTLVVLLTAAAVGVLASLGPQWTAGVPSAVAVFVALKG